MDSLSEVVPGLYRIDLGLVNAYLLECDSQLILIDTGFPGNEQHILRAVKALGCTPQDVAQILLTHAHPDHVGGASVLQKITGAELWMSPLDAMLVNKRPDYAYSSTNTRF